MARRRSSMKVKQLIKILEAVDDKLPSDMYELDEVEHHSTTHDEPIRIADMDVVHLVRAFRHQERKLTKQLTVDVICKLAKERDMWKEKAMNMVEKSTHEELELENQRLVQRLEHDETVVSKEAYDVAWKEWERWKARAEMWRKEYEKATSKKGCGYVFSEIPNDTDGQEFVDTMKRYLNKESYKMRVRGQHIKPELKGTGATYWGQGLNESTHMRIYIEAKKGD
jgi:regulator of replication initiation timing